MEHTSYEPPFLWWLSSIVIYYVYSRDVDEHGRKWFYIQYVYTYYMLATGPCHSLMCMYMRTFRIEGGSSLIPRLHLSNDRKNEGKAWYILRHQVNKTEHWHKHIAKCIIIVQMRN